MLLNDINARGSDRTGGTEKNDVFHFKASFFIQLKDKKRDGCTRCGHSRAGGVHPYLFRLILTLKK
jgi:hypothetical protein